MAKVLFVSSSIAIAVLLLVLQVTNPASIHPIGLLGVFFLIYITWVAIMTTIVYGSARLVQLASQFGRSQMSAGRMITFNQAYLYGSLLAFAPVILLGIQSVGSLGVLDVILVVVFEAVLCFYVWRRQ